MSVPGAVASPPRRGSKVANLAFAGAIALISLYNFPYFAEINSANELPRIYLVIAMVERGALNIDPEVARYSPTPDTAGYQGRLYANKAPGMSLLTVPVYLGLKAAHGGEVPPLKTLFFWFRLFGSALPSLLFLLLLWRFLGQYVERPGTRRLALAGYALGTMALTYGTLLIAHQLSALLVATGFILAQRHLQIAPGQGEQSEARRRTAALLSGLAAASGVLVDYQVAFIGPPIFLYIVLRSPRRLDTALRFCAGTVVPFAILLLYQWGCFDSPLRTGYHYPTTPLFKEWHSKGFLGMSAPTAVAFWGSFFRADNGLFYFAPFLLLAFPGAALMLRRPEQRADGIFCLGVILFFVYFVSSITFWRSGWAVGPRYITCALPFYLVPVAVLLDRLDRAHWAWRPLPLGLIAASILIYTTAQAVFPHYPENFSNPWLDLTLRFGAAGYVSYNLGWALGLRGLASAVPYLLLVGALLLALFWGGAGGRWTRARVGLGGLLVVVALFGGYYLQLGDRSQPVPVKFLPWMERIWEPRHEGMDLQKLLPAGDPQTGGLQTRRSPW